MENWYKIALREELRTEQQEEILKEAGFKDILKSIPAWLVSAVMAVSNGISVDTVKEKIQQQYHLDQNQYRMMEKTISNRSSIEDILEAVRIEKQRKQDYLNELADKEQQKAYNQMKPFPQQKQTRMTLDELTKYILKQEGVHGRQTPFRITSHEMRDWDTFQGFPVYHGKVPLREHNFIHLKNPEDVPKAVKRQFLSYKEDPHEFRLGNNPTVGQAIRVFDQSNAEGKLAYLRKYMPNFNENFPLKQLN